MIKMSERTTIFGFQFSGYKNELFSMDNTLEEVIRATIPEVITSVTDGSSSATTRRNFNFTINRLNSGGSIPFLWVKIANDGMANYLKKANSIVTASNNGNTRYDFLQTYASNSYTTEGGPTSMNDRSINDAWLGSFSTSSPFNRYYINGSWNLPSYDKPFISSCKIPIFLVSDSWNESRTNNIDLFMRHLITPEDLVELDDNVIEILNGEPAEVIPTTEYFYYGTAEQYTVDQYGSKQRTSEPQIYRGIRVKSKQRCSLYEMAGINDGVLKLGMNLQGVEIAYYSTDYGDTWQNQQGSPQSLPWDYLYRNWINEVGTFYCLTVIPDADYPTNMYVFKTKAESDAYNEDGTGEENAVNYSQISTGRTPKNDTGEEDDETEFGTVGVRSIFSQQYILSTGALSEIANAFFDVTAQGLFEDIKKGCEMYGDSVVDDIEGLMFYPVDLTQVFANSIISQNYIYFGGYQFNMQNSVNRIIYPNGYYDFGSFTIDTTFGNNIRSYEPYTKLYCYLAYIGWVQLDMKKYLHKTVNIRYYIDTRTGGCCAVLLANSVMCDFYNGQIGVQQPIKATDYNAYANAQIQTLLGFNKPANTGQAGQFASGMTQGLVESGAVSAGAMGVVGLGVGGAIQGTKTLYGLTQNNINNFNHTIGGSSSMLNMFLPQECCFMFEIQESIDTEYERELVGLPSNASGFVGSFNGYLECEQVNLVCSGATAKEQAEIIRYLHNGVYI